MKKIDIETVIKESGIGSSEIFDAIIVDNDYGINNLKAECCSCGMKFEIESESRLWSRQTCPGCGKTLPAYKKYGKKISDPLSVFLEMDEGIYLVRYKTVSSPNFENNSVKSEPMFMDVSRLSVDGLVIKPVDATRIVSGAERRNVENTFRTKEATDLIQKVFGVDDYSKLVQYIQEGKAAKCEYEQKNLKDSMLALVPGSPQNPKNIKPSGHFFCSIGYPNVAFYCPVQNKTVELKMEIKTGQPCPCCGQNEEIKDDTETAFAVFETFSSKEIVVRMFRYIIARDGSGIRLEESCRAFLSKNKIIYLNEKDGEYLKDQYPANGFYESSFMQSDDEIRAVLENIDPGLAEYLLYRKNNGLSFDPGFYYQMKRKYPFFGILFNDGKYQLNGGKTVAVIHRRRYESKEDYDFLSFVKAKKATTLYQLFEIPKELFEEINSRTLEYREFSSLIQLCQSRPKTNREDIEKYLEALNDYDDKTLLTVIQAMPTFSFEEIFAYITNQAIFLMRPRERVLRKLYDYVCEAKMYGELPVKKTALPDNLDIELQKFIYTHRFSVSHKDIERAKRLGFGSKEYSAEAVISVSRIKTYAEKTDLDYARVLFAVSQLDFDIAVIKKNGVEIGIAFGERDKKSEIHLYEGQTVDPEIKAFATEWDEFRNSQN